MTRGASRATGLPGSLTDSTVASYIQRLQGCLGAVPDRLRTVLRLLGGIGLAQPLSSRQAAARLHVPLARFRAMERQALLRLRQHARGGRCAPAEAVGAAELLFAGGTPASTTAAAVAPRRGAVGVASYQERSAGTHAPSTSAPRVAPLTAGPAGLSHPVAGEWRIVGVVAAAALLLLVLVVFAQSSGLRRGSGASGSGKRRGRGR